MRKYTIVIYDSILDKKVKMSIKSPVNDLHLTREFGELVECMIQQGNAKLDKSNRENE